ncbi:MAG: CHASE2 domain-containing protein [Calothrix sp. C42_A2020_038]|nr:CHASE2 domain-containing protein [Calothrix sp. C42_A2020_038]
MTAVFVTLAVIVLEFTGALQFLECAVLDQWFRLRPSEPTDSRVVIVTIDEGDISRFKSWPMDDATLAKLLDKIRQQQPKAIGLDLYRNLPVDPGHQELLKVYESTPNLIGIQKVLSNVNGPAVNPPPILGARNQVAACDLVLEADGKVRRYLLSVRVNGKTKTLTLGAKLALAYLETLKIKPIYSGGEGVLQLGKAKFVPLQDNDGGFVGADIGGYQILANFRNSKHGVIRIPVLDILENRVNSDLLKGKVVFVGSVAESFSERFYTPFSRSVSTAWSGVELHADLTSQILSAALDNRQVLRGIPEPLGWLWIFLWSNIGAALGWGIRFRFGLQSRRPTQSSSLLVVMGILLPTSIISLFVSAYLLFLTGWWVTAISPVLGLISAAFLSKGYSVLRSLQLSHKALANYAQTLELKVKERTQELVEKNLALEAAKQEAESANKAKSTFLANVSHELRTPLNAILGFSQILAHDQQLTSEQRQHIEIINRSGKHLLELINDVLSMSKIEAGRTLLVEKNFDLYALLDSIYQMLQLRARNKGLDFKFELVGDVPQYISTDESKLRQILINLLGNAIKFTAHGSITLKVKVMETQISPRFKQQIASSQFQKTYSFSSKNLSTKHFNDSLDILRETIKRYFSSKHTVLHRSFPESIHKTIFNQKNKLFTIPRNRKLVKNQDTCGMHGDLCHHRIDNNSHTLVFEVVDTGFGISPQDLEQIFNPFVQTQLGLQSMEGTGLGLAISREYVKLMGGEITVSSVINQGSTFRFDIKFGLSTFTSLEYTAPTQQITGLVKNQTSYRILVAEDVEENRLLLVKLLSSVGFEVRQATNGQEALEMWKIWRPHLILMDMRMPIMDGFEATQKIRELELIERDFDKYKDLFPKQKPFHTVIIALSASTFEEQQQKCMKIGCNAFISKPVCEKTLYEQIGKYLNVKYISIPQSEKYKQKINTTEATPLLEFHPDLLNVMSDEWIDKLHYAAISLNDQSISELVKEIPETEAQLAETLNNLVDNFRLDIIAKCIENRD